MVFFPEYIPQKDINIARIKLNEYFRIIKAEPDKYFRKVSPTDVEKIMHRIYSSSSKAILESIQIKHLGDLVNKLARICRQERKAKILKAFVFNY